MQLHVYFTFTCLSWPHLLQGNEYDHQTIIFS